MVCIWIFFYFLPFYASRHLNEKLRCRLIPEGGNSILSLYHSFYLELNAIFQFNLMSSLFMGHVFISVFLLLYYFLIFQHGKFQLKLSSHYLNIRFDSLKKTPNTALIFFKSHQKLLISSWNAATFHFSSKMTTKIECGKSEVLPQITLCPWML